MFRRDDMDDRFSIAGLWGSGNTVARRDGLFGGSPTVYSMWDGHALFGPERPGAIERFPVFVSRLLGAEFLARYGGLATCEVWIGEEELGVGCEAACAALNAECAAIDAEACLEDCAELPRPIVDCLTIAPTCEWETACGREEWAQRP